MTRTRHTLAALFATSTLVVTACGSGDDGAPAQAPTSADAAAEDTENPDASLRDLYNDALDNLEASDFVDDQVTAREPTGNVEYALADITADGTPELLVKAVGTEFSAVRALVATDDRSGLIEPEETFQEGAASAGGSRMALEASTDGDGLFATSGQSASGQTTTTHWEFDGAEMQESGQSWEYRIDQVPGDLESAQETIDWISADDRSAVDGIDGIDGTASGGEEDGTGSGSGPQPTQGADADGAGSGSEDGASLADNPGQVGGECGVLDGARVTAGDSTSCGFAMNVAEQALQPVYVHDPSVVPSTVTPPAGVATVTATSPATGDEIAMDCSIGTDGRGATCTGGNDATVWVRMQDGQMLHLVND